MFLREQSGVGEAVVVRFAENDVVENADAEDLRGFDQAVCAVAIFPRGNWISGGMVMNENDRSRAGQNSGFPYLPLMNNRSGMASYTDCVVADGSVFGIKRNRDKMLSVKCCELLPKGVKKLAGILEFRIFCEGILRFPHKHDPVTGKHVFESIHA